ncbi:hypothetical protein [Desulfitibacter alkalitolerans]|uniref:hypothetical protein n=1 Tax=Desulfitibacter alkalitolerans TaxID=264641 RepID=UPI000480906A|nr:hypothetical protein [Desulfitibacter alkalitolerans]
MNEWRELLYKSIEEGTLNSLNKVFDFIEEEFLELTDPIKKMDPTLVSMYKKGVCDELIVSIGENNLKFISDGYKNEVTVTNRLNDKIAVIKIINYCAYGFMTEGSYEISETREVLNKEFIDKIFKMTFEVKN